MKLKEKLMNLFKSNDEKLLEKEVRMLRLQQQKVAIMQQLRKSKQVDEPLKNDISFKTSI